ncbi:MAG: SDR family NAD(P)-dependent oxidoreductase [Bacteroidales bacterium]|nr:SDR family NAD(P)-dependent oxidoreductase [Bacteroidales bacterium]
MFSFSSWFSPCRPDRSRTGKVVLVTGASSGIGFEAALRLARQGHKVYGAARRLDKMAPLQESGVVPLQMDVTDEASMQACVQAILAAEGRIDVLVNNAGYGYLGAIENVPLEEARKQLEVNLFGLARLTQLILPHMRERRSGRIINLSSVAGRAVILFGGWYNVSKYAVEAFSDALRMEVKPFGIRVSIIEPSGIKTPWGIIAADNLEKSSRGSAYETRGMHMAAMLRRGYSSNLLSPAGRAAKAIVRATNASRPRIRYRTGAGAGTLIFLHANLPSRWWDAIAGLPGK